MNTKQLGLACLLFLTGSLAWAQAGDKPARIGVVDLGLAMALHPQMALFDFGLLGFVKVPLGLSREAFKEEVLRIRATHQAPDTHKRLAEIKRELAQITVRKSAEFQQIDHARPSTDTQPNRQRLFALDQEFQKLTRQKFEIEFANRFPELTAPDETRKRLLEIEQEVMDVVRAVALEKDFSLVLNNSVPALPGFPRLLNRVLPLAEAPPASTVRWHYALLGSQTVPIPHELVRIELNRWLHFSSHPEAQEYLPLRPWPLVLSGGEPMTTDVVLRLYEKYQVSGSVRSVIATVLTESPAADISTKPEESDGELQETGHAHPR